MPQVSIARLFEDNRDRLRLAWIAGRGGGTKDLNSELTKDSSKGLIGHLNFIHPNLIQVLGVSEVEYLNEMDPAQCASTLRRVATRDLACFIVAGAGDPPAPLAAVAEATQTPLFVSPVPSVELMWMLRPYLARELADSTTMHGVFLDVLGVGVLITGDSGVGKSELALELISRGHGLVADDAVDLYRVNQDTIEGRCPELLRNLLEVRGIGLLDIRAIFGETAVRRKMRLKLIVHLVRRETLERDYERIPYEPLTQDVLGIPVRKAVIQVVAGRNLAVLVEAAVRNTILQLRGIDTYQEFIKRHQAAMDEK